MPRAPSFRVLCGRVGNLESQPAVSILPRPLRKGGKPRIPTSRVHPSSSFAEGWKTSNPNQPCPSFLVLCGRVENLESQPAVPHPSSSFAEGWETSNPNQPCPSFLVLCGRVGSLESQPAVFIGSAVEGSSPSARALQKQSVRLPRFRAIPFREKGSATMFPSFWRLLRP